METPAAPPPPVLPPDVALTLSSPNPGTALQRLADLVRRVRPVPDLRALAQLTISQFDPAVNLDAPAELVVRRKTDGKWSFVGLFTVRPLPGDAGHDWQLRRLGRGPVQVTHLRPDLLAVTDDVAWVNSRRDWLLAEGTGTDAPDVRLRLAPPMLANETAPPGPPAPPASTFAPEGDLQTLVSQTDAAEVSLRLPVDAVELNVRVRPRPDSVLALALGRNHGLPTGLYDLIPAGAAVVVAGNADSLGGPWARALGTSFAWLADAEGTDTDDAGGGDETPPKNRPHVHLPSPDDSESALRPVFMLVQKAFVWALLGQPGTGRPVLFLGAEVAGPYDDAFWRGLGGEAAVAPAYRVGDVDVHRIGGTGRFLPADLAVSGGRLYCAAGSQPRGVLEGLLTGRLASGLAHHPAFARASAGRDTSAAILGTLDLAGLARLFAGGALAAVGPADAQATVYSVSTDGKTLEGAWRVPVSQVDRLLPLLRDALPRAVGPGRSSEWLFPEGI